MKKSAYRVIACICVLHSLVTGVAVANEDRTKKDLSQVQVALEQSQAEYQQQQKEIAKQQQKLKAHELAIAKNAKALNMAEQSVKETQQQQADQQQRAVKLEKQQAQFQRVLAAQLKSAYMAGSDDYSKMLLNQEDTAKFERTLSYYNYLNKARIKQLDELKALQIEIAKNQAELEKTKEKLVALFDEQKRRQAAVK